MRAAAAYSTSWVACCGFGLYKKSILKVPPMLVETKASLMLAMPVGLREEFAVKARDRDKEEKEERGRFARSARKINPMQEKWL
jgi:hypothetical protein